MTEIAANRKPDLIPWTYMAGGRTFKSSSLTATQSFKKTHFLTGVVTPWCARTHNFTINKPLNYLIK